MTSLKNLNYQIFLLTIQFLISFASTSNDDKDVDPVVDKANWVNPNDMVNFGQTTKKASVDKVRQNKS